MTNRQRLVNCVLGKEIDRAPFFFYLGPWPETSARWMTEGAKDENAWLNGFGFDPGIRQLTGIVNHYFDPWFDYKVIEETEEALTFCDGAGIIQQIIKGQSNIPGILENPVKCRDDWERIKKDRLNPFSPSRFPKEIEEIAGKWNKDDIPVQAGAFPYGLFGTLRDLMGVENLMVAFYDQPELIHDMMDFLTGFWLDIYGQICKYFKVDIIHIWEDISGKSGSLISPGMISEFMVPQYKRIKKFADNHNIPVIALDTDGDVDRIIPVFLEGGINMMMPFEVQAGCDVVKLREKYPQMAMLGGIDKMEIAKGKDAALREIERIRPLLSQSGYIPNLDHTIPPEIGYNDYCFFVEELRKTIYAEGKGV